MKFLFTLLALTMLAFVNCDDDVTVGESCFLKFIITILDYKPGGIQNHILEIYNKQKNQ